MLNREERLRLLSMTAAGGVLLAFGASGYILIEGWGPLDALYMTVTTLATVGFGEIHPLSPRGRMFTILLILGGVGFALYALSVVGELFFDGSLISYLRKRRMQHRVRSFENHCIICGFGRTGESVAEVLRDRKLPFVVIERDADVAGAAADRALVVVQGNAHDNEIMTSAGIEKARTVIACASNDAENVFICLTARSLRADVQIVARSDEPESEAKLRMAGANQVVSPYSMAGRALANAVFRSSLLDLLQTAHTPGGTDFEEIVVGADSHAGLWSIGELRNTPQSAVSILALRRQSGEWLASPNPDTRIQGGDTLLALGPVEQIAQLRDVFSS